MCGGALVSIEGGYITWQDNILAQKVLTEFEKMVSNEKKIVFYLPKGQARARELKLASQLISKAREFLDRQSDTQLEVFDFTRELIITFFLTKKKDYTVTSLAQVQRSFIDIAIKVYQFFKEKLALERNRTIFKDNPPVFKDVMRL